MCPTLEISFPRGGLGPAERERRFIISSGEGRDYFPLLTALASHRICLEDLPFDFLLLSNKLSCGDNLSLGAFGSAFATQWGMRCKA